MTALPGVAALLAVVAVVLRVRAVRRGRAAARLRHPAGRGRAEVLDRAWADVQAIVADRPGPAIPTQRGGER